MTVVSSAMILESVNTTLKMESERMNRFVAGEFPPNIVELIDEHIQRMTEMVASLAIARYGITRRSPSFDMNEVEGRVEALTKAIAVLTGDDTVALVGSH